VQKMDIVAMFNLVVLLSFIIFIERLNEHTLRRIQKNKNIFVFFYQSNLVIPVLFIILKGFK